MQTNFIAHPAAVGTGLALSAILLSIGEAEFYANGAEASGLKDAEGFVLFVLFVGTPLLLGRDWIARQWRSRSQVRGLQQHLPPSRGGEDSAFMLESEIGKEAITENIESSDSTPTASEAKSNADHSRYLATASHELRQPLQAMKIFIDALRATPLGDEQSRILNHVEQSHHSLSYLINTLLDISKINAGSVRPRSVPTGLHNIFWRLEAELGPLMAQKNLQFRTLVPRRNPGLRTDPDLLLTILRNLLGNAAKYTDRGGVLLAARVRQHHIAVQVWDTGIGIEAEHLPHIYTEFFRIADLDHNQTEGFGLGLSIVKRLAQLLDYDLDCRSRRGQGTVFELRIPLVEATQPISDLPRRGPAQAPLFRARPNSSSQDRVLPA